MIQIKINNYEEIAESRSFVAKLLPGSMLQKMVYNAVAEKLQDKLHEEGVDAVVIVSVDDV